MGVAFSLLRQMLEQREAVARDKTGKKGCAPSGAPIPVSSKRSQD